MTGMFRSEPMALCQLYLQTDTVFDFVKEVGEMGVFQFRDLNEDVSVFHKKFVQGVRRCEEMERKLRYFRTELEREGIKLPDPTNPEAPQPQELTKIGATMVTQEEHLRETTENLKELKLTYFELMELKNVINHAQDLFVESTKTENLLIDAHDALHANSEMELVEIPRRSSKVPEDNINMKVEFIAGTLRQDKIPSFMRTLWLVCRGNELMRYIEMPDEVEDITTGHAIPKVVFVIFFQGKVLETRVRKICEGYQTNVYPCPESHAERKHVLDNVMIQLEDLKTVIAQSQEQRRQILSSLKGHVAEWEVMVLKVKAIYHTMNLFNAEGRHFIAEGWCPIAAIDSSITPALKKASQRSQTALPSLIHQVTTEELPTCHRTNKFTAAFQAVIDAYGTGTYMEINPAPFSIITFPFLFAVMFGDAGHGVIMLLFALWMVLWEKQLADKMKDSEIWQMFFGGRYLILLMALFSIYTGIIYNDVFSKAMNIFGSRWHVVYDNYTLSHHHAFTLDPNDTLVYDGSPYFVGVDPVWQLSHNKITFFNSFKKKMSVILGVLQMLLGVVLSLFNHVHFKQPVNIWCEFVPMLLFQLGIFGYLCGMMFAKFVLFSAGNSNEAPSLLIGLINMFLLNYPTEPPSVAEWYPYQKEVQIGLLVLVFLCVPWMLFIKPFILRRRARKENVENFDFGEVFVSQCIHTIEYCLGCISHTASYLRLWALSLAHTQLAEVLWSMVFRIGLSVPNYTGALIIFMVFIPFAGCTVAILLLMEGLSAFLHTLRLHWVEFQSKFYHGEGFPFEPFHFRVILKQPGNQPASSHGDSSEA